MNIRVEAKRYGYDSFRAMHAAFKRQVNEAGILSEYKEKQCHETRGEKRRRKKKEAQLKRRKEREKLRYTRP